MARVSEEPAETIARAALGGCALLRQQYLAVVAQELDIVMTPERAAEEEKETTGALVGHVIAARAAAAGRIEGTLIVSMTLTLFPVSCPLPARLPLRHEPP